MSQEISKININNSVYNIKDAEARTAMESKVTDVENGVVKNALNFEQGLKLNGATIVATGNTVTFQ